MKALWKKLSYSFIKDKKLRILIHVALMMCAIFTRVILFKQTDFLFGICGISILSLPFGFLARLQIYFLNWFRSLNGEDEEVNWRFVLNGSMFFVFLASIVLLSTVFIYKQIIFLHCLFISGLTIFIIPIDEEANLIFTFEKELGIE